MSYGTVPPRVCFKAAPEPPGKAVREIARVLEVGLRTKVGPDAMRKSWAMLIYPRGWSRVLEIDGRSFTIVLGRSKWDRQEWLALVGANNAPVGPFHSRTEIPYLPQLTRICHAIQATLAETPWVSDIRWYLQQKQFQSPGVATPDELPWTDTEHK